MVEGLTDRLGKTEAGHRGAAWGSRWLLLLGILFALVLFGAVGCGGEAAPTTVATVSVPATIAATTTTVAPTTTTTTAAPTTTTVAPTTTTTVAPTTTTAGSVALRLAVYDDTVKSRNDLLEVWTKGLGSWYPDLEFGGDNTTIGPYKRNSAVDVYVYPGGRNSTEIRFTLTITADMISASDRDMVIIEVGDDRVVVTSTGLPDMSATFKR